MGLGKLSSFTTQIRTVTSRSQVLHQTEKLRNLRLFVMQKSDAHLALLLVAIHVGTDEATSL